MKPITPVVVSIKYGSTYKIFLARSPSQTRYIDLISPTVTFMYCNVSETSSNIHGDFHFTTFTVHQIESICRIKNLNKIR
jgi:hypothetical protein